MWKSIGSVRRFSNLFKPLEQDLFRAAVLLDIHALGCKQDRFEVTDDHIKKFEEEHNGMPYEILQDHTAERIGTQLVPMFEAIESGIEYTFSVKANISTVPNAGVGVFVNSGKTLIPGTVVALYPGRVFMKHEVMDEKVRAILGNNENYMLMLRRDGHVFDPRNLDGVPSNPYALGHYINHCGTERQPNVLQVLYDFPSSFPKNLRKHVPYAYANKPSFLTRLGNVGCFMKGIVMIATRPIQNGEELFLDYRFPDDPNLPWPDWYQPSKDSTAAFE